MCIKQKFCLEIDVDKQLYLHITVDMYSVSQKKPDHYN